MPGQEVSITIFGPGPVALPVPVVIVLRVALQKTVLRVMAVGAAEATVVVAMRLVQVSVGVGVLILQVPGAALRGRRPGLARGVTHFVRLHQTVVLHRGALTLMLAHGGLALREGTTERRC